MKAGLLTRTALLAACLGIASHGVAQTTGGVSIQVDRERTARRLSDGNTRQVGRPHMETTEIRFVFTIRASASAPESVTVEWVVLSGDSRTRHESARGTDNVRFTERTRQATLRTDYIQERGGSWSESRRGPSIEASLYGYGVRVTDAQGRVLASKYSPQRAATEIQWSVETETGVAAPPPAPTRPTIPMPVTIGPSTNDRSP